MKTFPILEASRTHVQETRRELGCPEGVPWDFLVSHEQQAQRNHRQSLKELANRGGLSPCEMVAILEDRDYKNMPDDLAVRELLTYLTIYQEAQAGRVPAPEVAFLPPEELSALRADAERWRAFIGSQRFKLMGWSGFYRQDPGAVLVARPEADLHFGLEVWSTHPAGDDPQGKAGRELLLCYTDELVRRRAAKAGGA